MRCAAAFLSAMFDALASIVHGRWWWSTSAVFARHGRRGRRRSAPGVAVGDDQLMCAGANAGSPASSPPSGSQARQITSPRSSPCS